MIEIHSCEKIGVEENFKVSAGPGAGKTHWLITHVKHVLRKSKRLAKTAKIACITYTNTGVDEIQERLAGSVQRVDVATIHSFLYRNVVWPYAFLLKDEDGKHLINLHELDGHDEHIPSPGVIYRWKSDTKQQYLRDDEKVYACLVDLDWQLDEQGELALCPRKPWNLRAGGRYSIRKDSLKEYKKLYWSRGELHHEDVLYFAYRLITEQKEVLAFVSAKYPYIFVDEFQDTHPIQTAIIKKIAEGDTVVGVIGDPAQSIYQFQGARRQDFIDFSLPSIQHYCIKGNRRSSAEIICLLNKMRGSGIQQQCLRGFEGDKVRLLLGDSFDAINYVENGPGHPIVLARNNEIVGQIRKNNPKNLGDLWTISRARDSNGKRQDLIYASIYAVELVFLGNYQDARKRLSKVFRNTSDGTNVPRNKQREYAVALLQELLRRHRDSQNVSTTDYNNWLYNYIKKSFGIKIGAEITRGAYKNKFAERYTIGDLSQSLRIKDDTSEVRTIHKAKGAQFGIVLVVLENEEELERITKADVESAEDDSRIYYVALSRAKDHLYITVPELETGERNLVRSLGIEIEEL